MHENRRALASLALLLVAVLAATARGDVVHLKNGARLEGTVVGEDEQGIRIQTKFGLQTFARADVLKVERGETPAQELARREQALPRGDAEACFELALFAGQNGMERDQLRLLKRAVRDNPLHEGAHHLLGNVRYQGRFVTVAERDRLLQEARAAEMRAQGLVEHEGRFVTPEEKQKLEQGLVLRDGEWISAHEAKVRDGFVQVDGRWVAGHEHWIDALTAEVEQVIGQPLTVVRMDHVVIYTDVEGEFAGKLAKLLEKGFLGFAEEFGTGLELDWLGGRRVDVFAFRLRFAYEKFVEWVGAERSMGSTWAERAKRVVSVYRFDDWTMGATYMANRGQEHTAAHCANMLGHVLINRYRFDGQLLPPFFDEAFAALFEYDLLGRNVVFSLGTGRYERSLQKEELKFFEDGQWAEALRESMRRLADTPLEQAVRRDFTDLVQMDVAKGMCLLRRWRTTGPDRVRTFFDALRARWPDGNLPPGHVKVQEAIVHAFHAVEEKDVGAVDQELRKFAMKKLE